MSASHPDGGRRWHGRRFFPQLSGLQSALDTVIAQTPKVSGGGKDVDECRAKQAARLARRAKRAGHP